MLDESRPLIALAGLPGSGKTRLLGGLAAVGEQVIDLERLAGHRGSVFGGLGRPAQPTHKQFQRLVSAAWGATDPARAIWIEDEGPFIGSVGLPLPLQEAISRALVVEVRAPHTDRIANLLNEYGSLPAGDLVTALRRAWPRVGRARAARAAQAVRSGHLGEAVALVLPYYDDAYRHRVGRCTRTVVAVFDWASDTPADVIRRVAVALHRV